MPPRTALQFMKEKFVYEQKLDPVIFDLFAAFLDDAGFYEDQTAG